MPPQTERSHRTVQLVPSPRNKIHLVVRLLRAQRLIRLSGCPPPTALRYRTLSRDSCTPSFNQLRRRVVGLHTGAVHSGSPVGLYANDTAACGASVAGCPSRSPGVKCELVCWRRAARRIWAVEHNAHDPTAEPELRTGTMRSTHALTSLTVLLPPLAAGSITDDKMHHSEPSTTGASRETGGDPPGSCRTIYPSAPCSTPSASYLLAELR